MNRLTHIITAITWCHLATSVLAQGHAPVLDQVPDDARGFVLLRDLGSTAEKVDGVAARLQIPAPKVGAMLSAYERGLDKERNLALAWLDQREGDNARTAYTHFVLYLPVKDYVAFIGQFNAEDTSGTVTNVTIDNRSFVVAKKEDFAIVTLAEDRQSLEHVLNAKSSITEVSQPFHAWLNQNDLTIALSPSGTSLMFSKLKEGLEIVRQGATAAAGENADLIESALDMYRSVFDAGEKECTQFAIGLRIKPNTSVEVHKRVVLDPDGSLVKAANLEKPEHPLAGLPTGPFVLAFDGALPQHWPKEMMAMSFNMLANIQGSDAKKLTEQQIDKLSETAAQSMQGVRSMSFVMGAGAPGESIYSHTVGVLRVDDSKAFLERYEKAISKMTELMDETALSGAYTVKRVQIDNLSVAHLTMDMNKFQFGGEDLINMKEYYQKVFGPDGEISVYLTPVDDRAIVMAYTSPDNLRRALKAYGDTGLASDAELKKTANLLPSSAQWIVYISPSGTMQFVAQMASAFAAEDVEVPEFPSSPPVGFAAELKPTHLDAQLVVPLETIDAVKEFITRIQQARE